MDFIKLSTLYVVREFNKEKVGNTAKIPEAKRVVFGTF